MSSELDTLRLLHTIRQDIFAYNNSCESDKIVKKLIEEYLALLPEKTAVQTYQKAVGYLKKETAITNFDLEKWRKTALEDEATSSSQAKAINKENILRSQNNKLFKQEATFKQKILNELSFNGCDVENKNLLSVQNEDNKKLIVSFADGTTESINLLKNNKKLFTKASWNFKLKADGVTSAAKKKEFLEQQKDFLSPIQVQELVDNKGLTFSTVKQELLTAKPAHKCITLAQYKKMACTTEFSPNIEQEYQIYRKLSFMHQEQFLEEIKIRKEYMNKHHSIFKELSDNNTPLRQIADKTFLLNKMGGLLNIKSKSKLNQNSSDILPQKENIEATVNTVFHTLIEQEIKGETGNTHIWSYFNKTPDNPRYSQYEIFLDHAVNNSRTIHSEIFHFDNDNQMRANIINALQEIKSQNNSIIPLSNDLAAEILCVGVFNEGIKRAQNEHDLAQMNKILNEFGLNIRFEEREITKIPQSETSNEYLKVERIAFREEAEHKAFADKFDKSLSQKFGTNFHKKEVHHFIPLRYNGFIDEELNRAKNYIAVSSQHEHNLDLHGLAHTFDTPVQSLVKDKDGEISSMTYSKMRSEGLGKTLFIPILQVKTNKGFEDVLSVEKHFSLSTDKTPVCYAQIPEYAAGCRQKINSKLK